MNDDEFRLITAENEYMCQDHGLRINRPGLHPSEASVEYIDEYGDTVIEGTCLRSCWYKGKGICAQERGGNTRLETTGLLGKAVEKMVVDRWKQMGIWIGNNIKFYNRKYGLSGELDAVIRDTSTNGRVGVEIKSFYGYFADRLIYGVSKPRKPEKPKAGQPRPHQFLQAMVYCWEYRDKLDDYRMYYINRGDGKRVEFRVGFVENPDGTHQCYWEQLPGEFWNNYEEGKVMQPYTVEQIYARYDKLIKYYKEDTLPPKDFISPWPKEQVEIAWTRGLISKSKYEKWKKGKEKFEYWQSSYCDCTQQCDLDSLSE